MDCRAIQVRERHGVTSLAYGAWDVAYRLTGVELVDGGVTLPDPGDLSGFRGQNGTVLKFEVTGGGRRIDLGRRHLYRRLGSWRLPPCMPAY